MYKFSNKEHTQVKDLSTGSTGIHKGVWKWKEYEKWLEGGGVTEPFDARSAADLLNDNRDKIIEDIKVQRDQRKAGGIKINDKWFHTDDPSRLQYLALLLLGDDLPPAQWKTMDKSFIQMTKPLLMSIFQAGVSLDLTLFQKAEELINAVKVSNNPISIDINSGWPENFFNK